MTQRESELHDGITRMVNYLRFTLKMTDEKDIKQSVQRAFSSEESAVIIEEVFNAK